MTVSRIGSLTTVLALALGIAACNSSTPPKMQVGGTGTKSATASTVKSSKPVENPIDKPTDKPTTGGPSLDAAKITKANFDQIKLEMTMDEVRAILGVASTEKKIDEGKETELTWQVGPKNITAKFRDGKLKVIDSQRLDEK